MFEIIEWVMVTPPIMFEVFRAVQITQWAFFKEQLYFFSFFSVAKHISVGHLFRNIKEHL